MSTALSASARALFEQMSLLELMADRRIERETLHAFLEELVVDEDVTLSHHRALGRLTCTTNHLRPGIEMAIRILEAEYVNLLANLRSRAAGVELQLDALPIEIVDYDWVMHGDQLG